MQTELLQAVLHGMGDGLVVADASGKFLVWNAAAERLLGAQPVSLPPTQWTEYFGLYDPVECNPYPSEKLPVTRAFRGEACDNEILIRTPHTSRSFWVKVAARPLKETGGAVIGAVVVLRDITSTKVFEQQTRKLQEEFESRVLQRTAQLEVANKELESFSSSVAHDLRAPLRHIAGFAEILLEDYAASLNPQAREYLVRIQQGIRRMGLMADELLNLAQVGRRPLHLQTVDLTAVARKVIARLKPKWAGRSVEWRIGELPAARCDAAMVRQVFQNLISNAIKYSRLKPHAVIEIGQTTCEEQPAIFVRDNGVGFNMKYAGKLFGVFQRLHTNEVFEGTGIGLATVQRIVQKHRGRVWAEAQPEQGATFYFTLKGLGNKQMLQKTGVAHETR
jgi:signal transduction histidine kinase